ncbi:MAG: hypothetical protein ACYDAJ_06975 [Nitrosotalea sp.]
MSTASSKSLQDELERLKSITGIKKDLSIIWSPRQNSKKEGEVIGNTIYVYSTSSHMALETLGHEFFDLIVSNAIKPYINLVNALLSVIGEDAYKSKEEVVESLLLLCQSTANERPAS